MVEQVTIASIPAFKIGHAQNEKARTGCTVILCEDGAVAGCDLRGSAPGTRETELLRPGFLVEQVQGVLLTGGSAFGLDAAGGVQQYLAERGKGYDARGIRVPIVPAAVIFDLNVGNGQTRPDKQMGYQACLNANPEQVDCGLIGVGSGATVGKILGMERAMNGGVGYAAETLASGVVVSALVVVNAFGDVLNPNNGKIIAGARELDSERFVNTAQLLRQLPVQTSPITDNTTLGVIMTNAHLNKVQINKVAQMAQDGLARVVRPVHTMYDGDLIFALSGGEQNADQNLIGEMAAECVAQAIIRAVKISNSL